MSLDAQPDPPRGGPLYEGWAAIASAIVAVALVAASIAGGIDFCLDDAWIHLSYAKSLRLGDGLSYNPGDWETGFSSPLWIAALTVWPTAPDPVVRVKLLGGLLHGLSAFFACTLALDIAKSRASVSRPVPLGSIALLAGVITASMPTLIQGALSGMEVALASAAILGVAVAITRQAKLPALLAGFLAVLARPEALFFVFAYAAALWFRRRSKQLAWAPIGSATALATWVVYCLVVTGHPWPNPKYVKASEPGVEGLSYLLEQVLPWQPWLVSLGGLGLIGLAVRSELQERRFELCALMIGWLACLLATALSRPLHEGVLFYEGRYFAIVAAIPSVPLALALIGANRWVALVFAVPVAVVTSLQLGDVIELTRRQEEDVHLLHTGPARYVAQHLPPDAIVAVEGAGAMRYFTPRSMTIVDIIGLNEHELAHAESDTARACRLLEYAPAFFVLPEHIAANLGRVFEFRILRAFDDPSYEQVEPAHPMRVLLLEGRARDAWSSRCEG